MGYEDVDEWAPSSTRTIYLLVRFVELLDGRGRNFEDTWSGQVLGRMLSKWFFAHNSSPRASQKLILAPFESPGSVAILAQGPARLKCLPAFADIFVLLAFIASFVLASTSVARVPLLHSYLTACLPSTPLPPSKYSRLVEAGLLNCTF